MNDYVLSPAAHDDLIEIWEYIADDSIDAADRVRDALFQAIDRLADIPHMGHIRQDLADEPLRFWRVYRYLIVYRAEVRPIEIVRVLSAYRDIRSILSGPHRE